MSRPRLRTFLASLAGVALALAVAAWLSADESRATAQGDTAVLDGITVTSEIPAWDRSVRCVHVRGAAFQNEPNSTTGTCGPPSLIDERGLVATYQVGDGPVVVYGMLPARATRVTARGQQSPAQSGRLFVVRNKMPESTLGLTFDGPSFSLREEVEPAIPTARFPIR